MSSQYGKLYVVATPIGNLADISFRAVEILKTVDLIAAEDTRHIKLLMKHYGISTKAISFHEHNEEKATTDLIEKITKGLTIALVSDAGTPLLNDPGFPLVKAAIKEKIEVSPIPGASALIAALSVSGLPLSRFTFEGFPPRTSSARKSFFSERVEYTATWVFYESSHRILATLEDMSTVFEPDREIAIARELTKLHETIVKCSLEDMLKLVRENEKMRKGEFVVIVEGAQESKVVEGLSDKQLSILRMLLNECSVKATVSIATEIFGIRKKLIYQEALQIERNKNQ